MYLHKMVMKRLIISDNTLHVKLNIHISVLYYLSKWVGYLDPVAYVLNSDKHTYTYSSNMLLLFHTLGN